MLLNGPIPRRLTRRHGKPAWFRLLMGWAAVSLGAHSAALAQATKAPDLAAIRKTTPTTTDQTTIENWINQQIQQLFAATDDKVIQTDGRKFYQDIATHVKAADATPKFRDSTATILANAYSKQYKAAAGAATKPRPWAIAYVLMSLKDAAQPTLAVVNAFKLGLTDPTPGGRMLSATGLLAIRDTLSDDLWKGLLPDVQKAAAAPESTGVALDRLYRIITVGPGPRVETAIPAVLNILDARLARFDQKKGYPALADAEAAKWLGEKVPTMQNAQQQNRATLAIARLLTDTVYTYVGKPSEDRIEPIEKTIIAAETQLKKIVAVRVPGAKLPSPDVTAAMLENGIGQSENMLLALHKWIGTGQEAGVLNNPPFGFEKGLKIAPPPPASRPAPAPAPETK